jgi:Flp pilus assembly pilin Flp
MNTFKNFLHNETGQTATEYMLIISVVVIAVVAAAYVFVPTFGSGVQDLSKDVSTILKGGCINKCAPR